jgi:predicted nucleic acid-binding protein
MNAAIVDTDVVSMVFKGDTRALAYRTHIAGRLLGIYFMKLAELDRWPLERNRGQGQQVELAQQDVRSRRTDAWIAASALYYQVLLITNNRDDYSSVDGLALLSVQIFS